MRRIGTLNGRAVVQGDPNIVKPNEILLQNKEGKISLSKRSEQGELSTITGGGGDKEDEDTIIIKGSDYYWKIDDPGPQHAEKYQQLLQILSLTSCVFSLIYRNDYIGELIYEKGIPAAIIVLREYTNTISSYVSSGYYYIAYIRECSGFSYQGLKADSLVDFLIKEGGTSNEQEAIEALALMGMTKVTKEEFEEIKQHAIER